MKKGVLLIKKGWFFYTEDNARKTALPPHQILAAIGANFEIACITLTAIETDVDTGRACLIPVFRKNPALFLPYHQVERQEDDPSQENQNGPEEPASKAEPVFLGVKKDPESKDETERRD